MIRSTRFTCILDTNIIYPIEIRDILFWFAHYDMFTPKWSTTIFEEWIQVMKRKNIPQAEINKRIDKANAAFPDALVTNYESLIDGLDLPDLNDRHVLAAAIKTNANLIVTNNLKDFPKPYLASFGLSVKNANDFVSELIDLNPNQAILAFKEMVLYRRNPPLDEFQVLDGLRRNGLVDAANYLHALL